MESFEALTPFAKENDFESLEQNKHVLTKRHVLDVIKVVLELFGGIFDGSAVRINDLRPPSDSRFYGMPQIEVRNELTQHVHEVRPLRPGAGETHVTAENVECLRNLVEAKLPKQLTEWSYAVVEFGCPCRTAL